MWKSKLLEFDIHSIKNMQAYNFMCKQKLSLLPEQFFSECLHYISLCCSAMYWLLPVFSSSLVEQWFLSGTRLCLLAPQWENLLPSKSLSNFKILLLGHKSTLSNNNRNESFLSCLFFFHCRDRYCNFHYVYLQTRFEVLWSIYPGIRFHDLWT